MDTGTISALGIIVTIIGSFLTYRYNMRKLRVDIETSLDLREKDFRENLISRINFLEDRKVSLTESFTKRYDELDERLKTLRNEVDTWRTKYYTLQEDHEALKVEYTQLEVRFTEAQKELEQLKSRLYTRH